PPANRRAMASTPSSTAKSTRDQIGGLGWPPEASISMTNEPESEDVMKKMATNRMAIIENMPPSGKSLRTSNNAAYMTTPCCGYTNPTDFKKCRYSHTPHDTLNESKEKMEGTSSTTIINCRRVLPRDKRSIKKPAKGAQDIHHPQ